MRFFSLNTVLLLLLLLLQLVFFFPSFFGTVTGRKMLHCELPFKEWWWNGLITIPTENNNNNKKNGRVLMSCPFRNAVVLVGETTWRIDPSAALLSIM